jgi:hypothetical protein
MSENRKMRKALPPGLVAAAFVLMLALIALRTPPKAYAHVVPSPCDFTTGGGFVFKDPWPNAPMVNFGIVGGCKNEGFFGHVNVVDHGTGLHINGDVTAYFDPFPGGPSGYRDLCGTDKDTGVIFRVRTKDNGEPGGLDRFGIKTTGGYLVTVRELGPPGETGGGGNIQLHKPNPSTTAPAVTPDEITVCGDDAGLGM